MSEQVSTLVLAVLGSGFLTAWVTNWFTRRKVGAEAEKIRMESEMIRMESADLLITRLSTTVAEQGNRISELEKENRELWTKLDEVMAFVKASGLTWPMMP